MHKEALLYERYDQTSVRCLLCPHHCLILPSSYGRCGVRYNDSGKLLALTYGYPVALSVDPVEKKPLYHFFPATGTFSVAARGCNFTCGFCQNWQISQVSPSKSQTGSYGYVSGPDIIRRTLAEDCPSISYTYTEPTVFFEYMYDISRLAHAAGLKNIFISNGYISRAALDMIGPFLDAANIDLKSFSNRFYEQTCSGSLQPVLNTITRLKEQGIWIEVTTLLIPGQNDTEEELTEIASFLYGLDRNIPWHISAFHPDYRFSGGQPTGSEALKNACRIGRKIGLRYVYPGNLLEAVETACYNCGKTIIVRRGFEVQPSSAVTGRCPFCSTEIAGVFKGGL